MLKKDVIGLILLCIGLALGAWLGAKVMLIDGIIQIIESIKAHPTITSGVTCGIVRVLFSGVIAWSIWAITIAIWKSFFSD